ncbi:MAG: single-stranded DNA-binding protein [Bacteroidales bacterium]
MINKVILLGNIGKDPDINYIQPDVPLAKFPLATDESFKRRDGQWEDRTEWHNIIAWRGLAKYVENNIKKGMQVFVEGKIQTRKYEDQNGQERYITQIVAESIRISNKRGLGDNMPSDNTQGQAGEPQPSENQQQQNTTAKQAPPAENNDPFGNDEQTDDDLPF